MISSDGFFGILSFDGASCICMELLFCMRGLTARIWEIIEKETRPAKHDINTMIQSMKEGAFLFFFGKMSAMLAQLPSLRRLWTAC